MIVRGDGEGTGISGPLLEELRNGRRYGDEAFVLYDNGVAVAVASAHFHTERKNAWTPYVNWVVVWTRPESRLRGHGRALSDFIRAEARARGCVRLRSIAASREGVAFHYSLGDRMWGRTREGTVLVDTPLDARDFPDGIPIEARSVTSRPAPLSTAEIRVLLRTPLLYDGV